MRRYLLYLTAALSAFGIGSFVVFNFYWITEEKKITSEVSTQTNKQKINESQKIYEQFVKYQDERSAEPYRKLIEGWLENKELRSDYISLITTEAPTENEPLIATAEIDLSDLNNDDVKELSVLSFCVGSGNCSFEIYEKNLDKYKTILTANMVQSFKIQKSLTNSYYDLQLITHNAGRETYNRLLKFNGKKYVERKCWFESYTYYDKNDKYHEVEKPLITSRKCGTYDYAE